MSKVVELLGDRYELEALIGSGGMGEVFQARDRLLDRIVAAKRPSAPFTDASGERFRREARAAARLNHPAIVAVYDWGDDGAMPYLVMEYVEGRSLRAILGDQGSLPPVEVARIGAHIADALAHAHSKGVIHRDVKPSNVLVSTTGVVKVTDFGIAQSVASESLTEPGIVLGTVGYLAPEQVTGSRADARSDVYSLGVVLTELLTGSRDEPDALDDDAPAHLITLHAVILRARASDPAGRFQHASELRDALDEVARACDAVPVATSIVVSPEPRTAAVVDVPTATVSDPTRTAIAAAAPAVAAAVAPVVKPAEPATRAKRVKRVKAPTRPPKPAKPPKPLAPVSKQRTKRERRWRAPHVAWLVAAPVTIALVAAGGLAFRALNAPAEATVPSVVGRVELDGIFALKASGLEYRTVERASPQPGGVILALRPRAGQTLHEGDTVVMVTSAAWAAMPDLIGANEADATAALRSVGLVNVAIVDDFTDAATPGTVTATQPPAFLHQVKADTVTLSVARDPRVTIPPVANIDEATARSRLESMGLVVVTQTESSRTRAAGQVISVRPGDGSVVTRGDTVVLKVSSGPRPVAVKPTLGDSWDDANEDLTDLGFVVDVKWVPTTQKGQIGKVIAQVPLSGQAPEGSIVTITVGSR